MCTFVDDVVGRGGLKAAGIVYRIYTEDMCVENTHQGRRGTSIIGECMAVLAGMLVDADPRATFDDVIRYNAMEAHAENQFFMVPPYGK